MKRIGVMNWMPQQNGKVNWWNIYRRLKWFTHKNHTSTRERKRRSRCVVSREWSEAMSQSIVEDSTSAPHRDRHCDDASKNFFFLFASNQSPGTYTPFTRRNINRKRHCQRIRRPHINCLSQIKSGKFPPFTSTK